MFLSRFHFIFSYLLLVWPSSQMFRTLCGPSSKGLLIPESDWSQRCPPLFRHNAQVCQRPTFTERREHVQTVPSNSAELLCTSRRIHDFLTGFWTRRLHTCTLPWNKNKTTFFLFWDKKIKKKHQTNSSLLYPPVLVACLWGAGPLLGTESGWPLLDTEVLDLLEEILVDPCLLDWGRKRETVNEDSILFSNLNQITSPLVGGYLASVGAALKAQAGHGGFVSHGDPHGGAGVPQVVLIDLPLCGAHHQTGTVRSELHWCQRTLCADVAQDSEKGRGNLSVISCKNKLRKVNLLKIILTSYPWSTNMCN